MGRDIVSTLNVNCNTELDNPDFDDPLYDAGDIPYFIPPFEHQCEMDMYPVCNICVLIDLVYFSC